MSEWIATHICNPPESHSVLLYIVKFYPDGKSMWDERIITGFYGNEDYNKTGYYFEDHDSWTYINETETLKVIAWTLLPRKPYKGILEGDWEG